MVIGFAAFQNCASLTSITIPSGVTTIENVAFSYCTNLTEVLFQGNAPTVSSDIFAGANQVTAYFFPGTAGWEPELGGRPTAFWFLPKPLILATGPSFGVESKGFGFTISWATNISVVTEASANLVNPVWLPVGTNTLTNGSSYFSDPDWRYHPRRFYRLRSP